MLVNEVISALPPCYISITIDISDEYRDVFYESLSDDGWVKIGDVSTFWQKEGGNQEDVGRTVKESINKAKQVSGANEVSVVYTVGSKAKTL